MHWTTALQIAVEQNPFPAARAGSVGYLSTGTDLICAILLALGL